MTDFTEVYNTYARQVFRFLLSMCRDEQQAEEMTQETFYRAFLHINQFKGTCSMYAWLCQIAKNIYFNEYKKAKKRQKNQECLVEITEAKDLFMAIESKEEVLAIHKLIHILKEPYKEVFTLKVFSELTFKDIANIFDKSESWAKVTYYRGCEKLMKEWRKGK